MSVPRPAAVRPPARHARRGPHAAAARLGAGLVATLLATAGATAATLEVLVSDAAGQPLPGAAVFLESREARAASRPAAGVELVQANRQFLPPVSIVPVGTAVSFPNRDTVRHHVYSFSPAKKFEIKLYVGTPASPVVFDTPGIVTLGCNIHDTMAAWVVVVETPHHGLTGADGRVALAAVPAGAYRLRAWHPGLPPGAPAAEQPLQLAAGGGAQAALRLAEVRR